MILNEKNNIEGQGSTGNNKIRVRFRVLNLKVRTGILSHTFFLVCVKYNS